jgi:hypothetical protein
MPPCDRYHVVDWLFPPELAHAPDLAVLAIVDAAMTVLNVVLVADYGRELADHERPYWKPLPPEVGSAGRILRLLHRLHLEIVRYREIRHESETQPFLPTPLDPDDFPF